MTTRVVYSRRAAAELEEITASLAEHSPPAAEQFLEALGRAEQQLSEFPNSGAPGLRPDTRRLVVANCIVSCVIPPGLMLGLTADQCGASEVSTYRTGS
jgi:plasmid stabilization system protein ParE